MLNLHSYENSLSKIQILFLKNTEMFEDKCKHKLWRFQSKYVGGLLLSENKLYQVGKKHRVTVAIQISIMTGNGLSPVSDTQINMFLRWDLTQKKLKCATKHNEQWVVVNES